MINVTCINDNSYICDDGHHSTHDDSHCSHDDYRCTYDDYWDYCDDGDHIVIMAIALWHNRGT